MKRHAVSVVVMLCAVSTGATAQVDTLWTRIYPGTQLDGGDVVADATGNIYVAGRGFDNFGDYLLIKYNAAGTFQWAKTYDGPGNGWDQINAATVDPFGNVIVTGTSYGGVITDADYCTIKYTPSGDTVWVRRHNGYAGPIQVLDVATAVVTDDSGNVYVTGYGSGPASAVDVFTIKYSPNGDSLWGQYYNFPATNGGDRGWAITRDQSGNIIVAGESWGGTQIPPATGKDYLVLKYSSGGTPLLIKRQTASTGPNDDVAQAVVTDGAGNIFVTGFAQSGAWYVATFRFSPIGDSVWQRNYTALGLQGRKIATDGAGYLYVGGDTYHPNYLVIKYALDGTYHWAVEYDNGGSDQSIDMAVDAGSNIYITGSSGGAFNSDFATVKYDSGGNQMWVKRFDSGIGDDIARAMHLLGSGELVVAGSRLGSGHIQTVRYSENPVSVRDEKRIPSEYALLQNYPNPFNPKTNIEFRIADFGFVSLKVYDVLGREVATLVSEVKEPGSYEVVWDASGHASGVYFYKFRAATADGWTGLTKLRKMMFMK